MRSLTTPILNTNFRGNIISSILGVDSGSQVFLPNSISDLNLWLDASDTATITHSSNAVSAWLDKSTNAYSFTQSTGTRQPLTNTSTINGRNVIDFDGTDDFLNVTTVSFPSLANLTVGNTTTFLVSQIDTLKDQFMLNGRDGVNNYYFLRANSANNIGRHSTTADTSTIATVSAGQILTNVLLRDGTTQAGYLDGGAAFSNTSATDVTLTELVLGALTLGNRLLDGKIAELIVYKRALSGTEIDQVGNYLAAKWGITWTSVIPQNTVAPALTGSFFVGQTLTCSTGTWTNSPTGYTYQWQNNGVDIGGATSNSYTLVAADDHDTITCRVTATNVNGSNTASSNGLIALQAYAWHDASDTSTITHVSNSVSQWNDKSGNARHATQGTALNQPITNTRTINGLNVIDFDGTNHSFTISSMQSTFTNAEYSFFVINASDDNVATSAGMHMWASMTGGSRRGGFRNTAAGSGLHRSLEILQTGIVADRNAVGAADYTQHFMAGRVGTADSFLNVDGNQVAAGAGATFGTSPNGYFYGRSAVSGSNGFFNGVLCECAFFEGVLTNAEIAQLRSYSISKWATP